MISVIANKIVNWLYKEENLEKEFYEVYCYGIELLLSTSIGIILVFLIGGLFFNVFDSFVFLLFFITIRKYSGGYHADTYLKCEIIISLLFVFTMILAKTFSPPCTAIHIVFMLSYTIVLILCPVTNNSKPLDKYRIIKCKVITTVLMIISHITCFLLYYIGNNSIYKTIFFTIITIVLLVPIGIIKNKEEK